MALTPAPLFAHQTAIDEQLQVHGFFSQAAAMTDVNNVGGESSRGWAFDLREIGLNASWRPSTDWLLAAQGLMRWAGKVDQGELRLDHGFVEHSWYWDDSRVNVQLGKVKIPFGLYNMTRDVAHMRPGVFMPQSVYWERIRDFVLAAPGAGIHGDDNLTSGTLRWHATWMRPNVDSQELENLVYLYQVPGRVQGKPSWMAQTVFDTHDERWRIGLTFGELAIDYAPGVGDPWLNGRTRFRPRVFSLERNEERWSLAFEYAEILTRNKGYGPAHSYPGKNTVQAYYLQAGYRPDPSWQIYARYDALYISKHDKKGRQLERDFGLPGHLLYARDYTLGLRHDLNSRWSLWGELHKVRGTLTLSGMDNPQLPQRDWTLFLLQAAYRF
ncbi:MAG: hypothetical protein RMK60_04020 [Burkholderiales bacterium]|nr:hypothetical protein [Burkholderiales bacterium]